MSEAAVARNRAVAPRLELEKAFREMHPAAAVAARWARLYVLVVEHWARPYAPAVGHWARPRVGVEGH